MTIFTALFGSQMLEDERPRDIDVAAITRGVLPLERDIIRRFAMNRMAIRAFHLPLWHPMMELQVEFGFHGRVALITEGLVALLIHLS